MSMNWDEHESKDLYWIFSTLLVLQQVMDVPTKLN